VPGEGGENTYCPGCGDLLIERFGFSLTRLEVKGGRCKNCNTPLDGVGIP